ncbi:hypothetical protein BOTBODRAFT_26457 [Botryobasidium botryosum FD-172 SS1]|uniref:Dienelactone hydrolase domain-containing protein n=1 Tax=Botryobasidium botryosum (strain FD-172 SS1) TaxID=930990 RepID=A0A067N0H6_BOTB1|nr:hypothetical protein BOTBODRAFT_26457 [Botryobasidium botryosum FD-172 SS1]
MSSEAHRLPVVEVGYKGKGSFAPLSGIEDMTAYIVGPNDAKQVVVIIYDPFGFSSQILQGADIISSNLNAKVIIPDILRGQAQDYSRYAAQTEEEKTAIHAWFRAFGDPNAHVPTVLGVARAIKSTNPNARVGVLGLDWGGKIAIKSGTDGTPYDAVASVHPAFIDDADARDLTVPIGFFPVKDHRLEQVEKVRDIIAQKPFADKNTYHLYDTIRHGFAGARGDLGNSESKKQYEHVYNAVSDFFKRALEV